MTAAGDAVLALAYTQVGTQSGDAYWAWWGADLGSYCACFVSWCGWHAGYPVCPIDGSGGFVLVSNGTVHSYSESEAKPTYDLQPGDVILFSWYSWSWSNGMPVITDPEWAGWIAGDHTGLFSHWLDQNSGQFATVEGNTSGGVVAAREDRYTSQVCGWWRPPSMDGVWEPDEPPKPTYNLLETGMFIVFGPTGAMLVGPGYSKGLTGEEYEVMRSVPGMAIYQAGDNQRACDVIRDACMQGSMASES